MTRLVIAAVFILMLFSLLLSVACEVGANVRAEIKTCHEKGPQYHYWQERKQCVIYLEDQ